MPDLTSVIESLQAYGSIDPVDFAYYDQLFNHRTVLMNQDVDESIVEYVIIPLLNFENDNKDDKVTLMINTAGGSVLPSLPLVNILNNYKKKLDIIVFGCALSMGSIFLAIDNPNVTRKCYEFSTALLHSGDSSFCGDSNSVRDTLRYMEGLDKRIKDFIVSKTKITQEQFEDNSRKQWWISGPEMLELGLIDEIIS